jgi:hypothetical protein
MKRERGPFNPVVTCHPLAPPAEERQRPVFLGPQIEKVASRLSDLARDKVRKALPCLKMIGSHGCNLSVWAAIRGRFSVKNWYV